MNTRKFPPEQEKFILSNYENMTNEQMAVALGIAVTRVEYFRKLHNLKRTVPLIKKKYGVKRQPIAVPVKTTKYWPPDHTNPSREDHVRRILQMSL